MQHYTTIEQSKKLVELGLNLDTADMFWATELEIVVCAPYLTKSDCETLIPSCEEPTIPCWSLGALIDIMPCVICNETGCAALRIHKDSIYHVFYKTSSRIGETWCSKVNLIDAVFQMVCWLLENGYIKKGE